MGWMPIEPKNSARERADVTLGIGGRKLDRYVITMKTSAVPKGWKLGTRLAVSLGGGEHHGQLLISAEGVCPFELRRVTRAPALLSLRVPLPEGVTQTKRAGVAVKATVQGRDLVLVLPGFAQPPAKLGSVMGDGFKPKR